MADPVWVTYYSFRQDKHNKVHNLSSDTIKAVLVSDIPDETTDDELADVTQVANGNGYTTGGLTLASVSSAQSSGTYVFKADDFSWTATGGDIGPFRAVVLYNDTSTGDKLIAHLTYDFSITIPNGETLTVEVNATTGFFYGT